MSFSSRAATYRPAPPPPASMLREIVIPHFDQRFDACVAVCATIWGYGLRMCRNPLERKAWMAAYFEHLDMLLRSSRSGVLGGEQTQRGEDKR